MEGCGMTRYKELFTPVNGEIIPDFDNKEWRIIADTLRGYGVTTKQFADKCKLKPSIWCDIREGRRNPTIEEANIIKETFNNIEKDKIWFNACMELAGETD